MEKAIEKLKKCIMIAMKEFNKLFKEEKDINQRNTIVQILCNCNILLNYLDNNTENNVCNFMDFKLLSFFFEEYNFNKKEVFYLTMFIFNKNVELDVLEKDFSICNYRSFKKNKIINGLLKYIYDVVLPIKCSDMFEKEYHQRSNVQERIIKGLCEIFSTTVLEGDYRKKCHKDINEFYLMKKDTYELSDIDKIKESLLSLQMNEYSIESIVFILKRDLEKRLEKDILVKDIPVKEKKVRTVVKQEPTMSQREYKKLLQQLKKYFDIDNNKPTHLLTNDEIIECTQILVELNFSTNDIKNILSIIDSKQQKELNPIAWYLQNQEKLSYYGIDEKSIENLNSYFRELFLCATDDYSFLKNNMEQELKEVRSKIPKTYQYEMEIASIKRTK